MFCFENLYKIFEDTESSKTSLDNKSTKYKF